MAGGPASGGSSACRTTRRGRTISCSASTSTLTVAAADQVGDQARPAGLVGGAEAGRVVAVEVLAEHEIVLPRRVVLQAIDPPEAGPSAIGAGEEDRDQPVLQVQRDGVQRQPPPSA